MFRLHIDIPLGTDEADALRTAKAIIEAMEVQDLLRIHNTFLTCEHILQYRVSNDDDRRMNNYLDKDEQGHVSGKKIKVEMEPIPLCEHCGCDMSQWNQQHKSNCPNIPY